jgi:hypothetical protein
MRRHHQHSLDRRPSRAVERSVREPDWPQTEHELSRRLSILEQQGRHLAADVRPGRSRRCAPSCGGEARSRRSQGHRDAAPALGPGALSRGQRPTVKLGSVCALEWVDPTQLPETGEVGVV